MAVVDSTIPEMIKVAASEKKQASKDLQKTRLCVYNLEGKCGYGNNCTFAHTASEVKNVPDLRKTQLCTKFAEGKCTNPKCTYAHGEAELKDPPNFKKKMCKWFGKGNCLNGANCGFAHEARELRAEAPPGFQPFGAKAPLSMKRLQKVAPPPGLTKVCAEPDCDASTDVPSSIAQSQAESELSTMAVPSIPEEHLFRFMAGRGSAPLQHQVALMSSAIGGLQTKLAQLEDQMLQNQVIQMQQQIEQLSEQCLALESGITMNKQPTAPIAPTSLRSRLNVKAKPFSPYSGVEGNNDDSVSADGSE